MELWWFVLSLDLASLCLRRLADNEVLDACVALPGFIPTLTGGDGDDTQFCEHRFASISLFLASLIEHERQTILDFVGYWPNESAVVVAHQGTDPNEMYVPLALKALVTPPYRMLRRLAVLTDIQFHFMALDPDLFPDIPNDIEVHSGFATEHMKTASQTLTEVERLMNEYSSTHVILVRLYYRNLLLSGRRTYPFRYYIHRLVTHLAEGLRNLTRSC